MWASQHLSACFTFPESNTTFEDNNGLNINYLQPKLLGFSLLNINLKSCLPLQIYMWKLQQMDLIYYSICEQKLLELEKALQVSQILEREQICQLSKLV